MYQKGLPGSWNGTNVLCCFYPVANFCHGATQKKNKTKTKTKKPSSFSEELLKAATISALVSYFFFSLKPLLQSCYRTFAIHCLDSLRLSRVLHKCDCQNQHGSFPHGPGVKNSASNAGDTVRSLVRELTSHMLWGSWTLVLWLESSPHAEMKDLHGATTTW